MNTHVPGLNRRLALILVLALNAFGAGSVLALPPERLVLDYVVRYSGRMSAEAGMRTEMTHDGKSYVLTEASRGRGLAAVLLPGVLRRSARGNLAPAGMQSLAFADQRGNRPEQAVQFDWPRQQAVFSHEGKSESRPLPGQRPLVDRLSFLWWFAFAPEPPKPGDLRPVLVDARGFASFHYRVSPPEEWNSPAGSFRVVRLVKQGDTNDERGTEIWLAADRGYLPVRVLVTEKDGSSTDQIITGIGH